MGYVTRGGWSGNGERGHGPRWHDIVLVGAVLAFLIAKVPLLSSININWDEFQFLSRVFEHQRGDLTTAFQTFHVHLFQWLAAVPGTEVDQIVAARTVAYALRVADTMLVFVIALRLTSRSGALAAALASLTFSYVLRHGESFRADPLIAFLFLLSAALLLWRLENVLAVVVAAIALALAASITVKTAIYLPALAGLVATLWWQGGADERPLRLRRAVAFGVVAAISYGAFYLFHSAATSAPSDEVVRRAAASGAGMVSQSQFGVLAATLRWDWPFWVLFAGGGLLAIRQAIHGRGDERARALLLVALLLPLASLVLYRNTFQYFYTTIVPLASLACGYAIGGIEQRTGSRPGLRPLVALALTVPLVIRGVESLGRLRGDGTAPQRQLLAAVHSIFPEPVPYLDRCGMVSSFPGANIFMSTYVLAAYRARGEPRMARIVVERQPRFLLANVGGLALDEPWKSNSPNHHLLREDFDFLRDNFIQHWGPIWVPGKRIELSVDRDASVTIVVGGRYTVEGDGVATIDGAVARTGDVVPLAAGVHRFRAVGATRSVTLRLGADLQRPREHPPTAMLFQPL